MSVREAVEAGDRRVVLETLVESVASALDAAEPGELPALSRELRLLLKELAARPRSERLMDSMEDALAARRAAKQAADG